MAADIIKFISRHQQLQLRASRNYSRWMMTVKGLVAPDGPEGAQWRHEQLADDKSDRAWDQRHGPLEGGGLIASFPERAPSAERPRPQRRRTSKR